jgi:hypothetical protein
MTEFEQGEGYLLQGILFRHTPDKTDEHHEKHVMTPGNAVKIRTRYFPNTSVPVWYQTIFFRSLSDLVVSTGWHYPQFWTNLQQATQHYVVQIRADTSARGIASMLVVRSPADTVVVRCLHQTSRQHSFQRCYLMLWINYISLMAHISSFLNKSNAK